MKVYGIKPKLVQIKPDIEFWAVSLGDQGRGRTLTYVPCPETFEFLEPGLSKTGKPRLNASSSDAGWIVRVSTEGAYIRNADGNISCHQEFIEKVKVVARGHGAFGIAGRIGTWDDLILVSSLEDFWLRVKPSRGPAYILLFQEGTAKKIDYSVADAIDLDVLGSSPVNRGSLIRL